MGLAGPSKKRKISHDPNNTKWTRSTGFGHKMLLSQGWSPGTILGPDPNSPHHTIASQVGIKVMLKDDNLGLGCKGNQEDTCTGLGDLQSLLGRLNGKTDESVRSEEDTRRKMWIEGRYGMRFVKGETLESTWVTKELKKGVEEDGKKGSDDDDDDDEEEEEEEEDAKESESEDEEEDESETSDGKKEQPKKEKKGKDKDSRNKKRKSSDSEDDEDAGSSSSSSSKDRKSDKSKRKADKALRKAERQAKRERKEAKRQRKDEKRRAKAEKKALKSAIAASSAPSSTASTPPAMPSAEPEPLPKLDKKSKSLPSSLHGSGTSTPVNGRQALRSKWIAQKRMAVMDAKALNEILMIKAA
ncbi:telomerase inhibitor [Orbilia oligospora]|nr:telomerase inhibitor [Orbilia oligospora]KAF3234561.1 telomerase inhibitor [Orbilia oligospora]KAF3248673.1 telomerase inhibitor [Orbilia oligospora]